MAQTLQLSEQDQARMRGQQGKAMQFAMQTIVAAAEIDQAQSLIDISFAHIDACFYSGRAHLDFIHYMLEHGASLAVPSWTNNGLVSLNDLSVRDPMATREMNEAKQLMEAYIKLGCNPVWTCAPYQLPGGPAFGEHIVGSESNAVSYYNSVVGARTNKYGDYLDVCAAMTGRVPYSYLHRDETRAATILISLEAIPDAVRSSDLFYHLLGHCMGKLCGDRVPLIQGLVMDCSKDDLKAVSAACCSSGSVPLFHALGITPEAMDFDQACQGRSPLETIDLQLSDLARARRELGQLGSGRLDGISLGTPHFSIDEFARLVELLDGRSISPGLVFYLTTSRHVFALAQQRGWVDDLRQAGVDIITDTCTYFSPAVKRLRGRFLTNSAKWAYYAPGMLPVEVCIASLQECVESAVSGELTLDYRSLQ